MNYKPCIIVLSYPDTEKKLEILKKSLDSVSVLNIPILLCANMEINIENLSNISHYLYTGENEMISASDYLGNKKIVKARSITKYRHHLIFNGSLITHVPLKYGVEKNYYWALIKLYMKSFNYAVQNGYTHFMFLQELEFDTNSINKVTEYFNETYNSDLDGIICVDTEMGEKHFSDFVFFGKTKWWSEMFNTTSVEEFYNLTYPNWSVEDYIYKKCEKKEGKIKLKVNSKLDEWQSDYHKKLPNNWIKEDIKCDSKKPYNLFFPYLKMEKFIENTDTQNFDVEKSLVISLNYINDKYQLFVWNKQIDKNSREISVKINFPIEKHEDIYLEPFNKKLLPGQWNIINYNKINPNREINVVYSYLDDDYNIITKNKIYNI